VEDSLKVISDDLAAFLVILGNQPKATITLLFRLPLVKKLRNAFLAKNAE
jgi:hypothetical protein